MSSRWLFTATLVLGSVMMAMAQPGPQSPSSGGAAPRVPNELELVEKLVFVRRNYQQALEQLRFHYKAMGDQERLKMAEDELVGWHRCRKHAFIEELEVPPPNLKGNDNIVDANNLLTRALRYMKDGGWGDAYIDNQRRAEVLLQELLTKYPQSNKISVAAYALGDIYEGKSNQMYRRAAWYFTRSYQWNSANSQDARLRAARIYDLKLQDRSKALEIYRDITTTEHDPAHRTQAEKRIAELSGKR